MTINNTIFQIPIINNVLVYDTISSTNTKAKELSKRGSVDGTLVIARSQTAGRGRMGRGFSSPVDEGIYMSLMLRPDIDLAKRASLTLVAAMAVVTAIRKHCGIEALIKWPNDIVIHGKKLVGILTEAGSDYVVIGIGINVNNKIFPEAISTTATSILKETGEHTDIFELIKNVLIEFNSLYEKFLAVEDLSFMTDSYNSLLASFNKKVYLIPYESSSTEVNPYLIDTSGLEPVVCMGINCDGNLICTDRHGNSICVNSGEVSLRGLQGYIS